LFDISPDATRLKLDFKPDVFAKSEVIELEGYTKSTVIAPFSPGDWKDVVGQLTRGLTPSPNPSH